MVTGYDSAQPLLDRLGKRKIVDAGLYVNQLADVNLAVRQ